MIAIIAALAMQLSQQSAQPEYSATCYLARQLTQGGTTSCVYSCPCGERVVDQPATRICQITARLECW